MLEVILFHLTFPEIISDSFLLIVLVLAWYWPHMGERFWAPVEQFGTKLAENRLLAVISIAAAAILIRLSLLWYLPIPNPRIHGTNSAISLLLTHLPTGA